MGELILSGGVAGMAQLNTTQYKTSIDNINMPLLWACELLYMDRYYFDIMIQNAV